MYSVAIFAQARGQVDLCFVLDQLAFEMCRAWNLKTPVLKAVHLYGPREQILFAV